MLILSSVGVLVTGVIQAFNSFNKSTTLANRHLEQFATQWQQAISKELDAVHAEAYAEAIDEHYAIVARQIEPAEVATAAWPEAQQAKQEQEQEQAREHFLQVEAESIRIITFEE